MIDVRIHGRGGQGNVVAAYLLATAAFEVGRHCQAFPGAGGGRRGVPVTVFVRIHDQPIPRRGQVLAPAFLIVQDSALLHNADTTQGLKDGGGIVVNSAEPGHAIAQRLGRATVAVPATQMARDLPGKAMPTLALLAAFLALTGLMPTDILVRALAHRFNGPALDANIRLIQSAADMVPAGAWKDVGEGKTQGFALHPQRAEAL